MSVGIDDRDGIRTITLDRPDKRNAITSAMFEMLCSAFSEAAADDDVRVVLFRGAGGQFTAGLDLGELQNRPPPGQEPWSRRFLVTVADFPKPVVMVAERFALGVGCTVLLLADLVYAAEGTVFRAPFVAMGLVPEAASTLLLPRMAGHQVAAEILLTGEPFDTAAAHRAGIVNEVLPATEVHEIAQQRCAGLAKLPPAAVMRTKALIRRSYELNEAMAAENAAFDDMLKLHGRS